MRVRSTYGQPATEAGRLTWRDMRPVLLKSAGIVGLAGAIMAIVSSNALFVDPGGPDRPSQSAVGDDLNAPPPAMIVTTTSYRTGAAETETAPPPQVEEVAAAEVLPPAGVAQPETTASVIPAEPRPVSPPPPQVSEPAASPVELQAASATPDAPTADVAEAVAMLSPSPVADDTAPRLAPAPAPAELAAGPAEEARGQVSAYWPKDSIECPRDWVATPAADHGARAPDGCETIASLVGSNEGNLETLHNALSEDVLDLVAMAPAIPVPGATAPTDASAAEQPASEPEPQPKPTPVRAKRNGSWPDGPPPDCGAKHAYWHFIQGHHGAKEWYCK